MEGGREGEEEENEEEYEKEETWEMGVGVSDGGDPQNIIFPSTGWSFHHLHCGSCLPALPGCLPLHHCPPQAV